MGLVKYFCLMNFVLMLGLVGWSVWEWHQWPIDFGKFTAEPLNLPPYDPTFRERIDRSYFANATVIRNEK